jgi:Sigma-70, region 4
MNATRLWQEISRLPQQQRDAIILREVAGLSYEELALLLGVTHPGVESLLFRARGRLRTRLQAARASVNLSGIVSEATAAVARLLGSGAAPLAAKAAAVGVGVAVVGGGGVMAERRLDPKAADAARIPGTLSGSVPARAERESRSIVTVPKRVYAVDPIVARHELRDADDHVQVRDAERRGDRHGPTAAATVEGNAGGDVSGRGGDDGGEVTSAAAMPAPSAVATTSSGRDSSGSADGSPDGGQAPFATSALSSSGDHGGGELQTTAEVTTTTTDGGHGDGGSTTTSTTTESDGSGSDGGGSDGGGSGPH